ncbi:stage II sporulation protein M [Gemella cuniculi]|uniref:stage II sporulation protein M n=1 Tax=Gemella cuniculi TaxID=150240 RepID=UPI0003FE95F1|nr:stage II sporulation protein M [Gemella cuniculi]
MIQFFRDNKKEQIRLYLLFWVFPFVMFLFSFMSKNSLNDKTIISESDKIYSFLKIAFNNLWVCLLIVFSGTLSRYLPLLLYSYNSLSFSIIFLISLQQNGKIFTLLTLLPHSFFEVYGLLLFTSIGIRIKSNYKNRQIYCIAIFSGILIIFAAFVEVFISQAFGGII